MDKKHLNKIVGYLLDDFEGINLVQFSTNKVWDILEYDYGLNTDERLYVYGNLLYQINIKMKDYGSINESSITRKSYLDKILDYIVEDTMINSRDWEPYLDRVDKLSRKKPH